MFHIIDNIYLSNLHSAHDPTLISKNNIRVVCRLSEDKNENIYGNIKFYNYEIEDNMLYKIEILRIAEDIAHNIVLPMSAENANVLIHCNEGRSRSVSVIIYYMMTRKGFTYDDALSFIKKIKSDVRPNDAFASILQNFYTKFLDPRK